LVKPPETALLSRRQGGSSTGLGDPFADQQGELGKEIGPPNDVGFENFDWPTLGAVREALEALGIGYGVETSQPGKFYEYPGDPLANGVSTPVNHTEPR
jgi:hypothetical protein